MPWPMESDWLCSVSMQALLLGPTRGVLILYKVAFFTNRSVSEHQKAQALDTCWKGGCLDRVCNAQYRGGEF